MALCLGILVVSGMRLEATPPVVYNLNDQTKLVGATTIFSVAVSGATSYQWYFNGSPIDGTTTTYTIYNTQPDAEGYYTLAAVNNLGEETDGNNAYLTVVTPAQIVGQPDPAPDPIYDGDSYVFSVDATGTDPLTYQWRLNGVNLAGETDNNITATRAGVYTVKVSNVTDSSGATRVGGTVISSNATLVVWFPPTITVQPTSRIVLAGRLTTFNVTATGTKPMSYQWLFNDQEILGATTNSYTISKVGSTNAGNYSVHISNIAQDVFSDYAELDVLVPPKIITAPVSQTANQGDDVTFNVSIQDDATYPVDYQWRFKGVNIDDGGTGEFLYLPDVQLENAGYYSVVISNEAGVVTSTNFTLAVRLPPNITSDPKDARVGFGTNLTFSIKATGTAPMYYQWLFNDVAISGATNLSYSFKPTGTNRTGLYSVFVSNIVDVVTSAPAVLTVIGETALPTITITSPLSAFTTVTNPDLIFAGKAADNVVVSTVAVQLNSNAYQTASGTVVWSMPLTLAPGTNVLRAKSIDSSGNVSLVGSRTVFYSVKSPLVLITNGLGTISGPTSSMLEINRGYLVTAKPGVGQIFAGWTGTISNSNAALTFMMRSNMVLQANFIPDPFLPRKGVYSGLFYETNSVQQISSGAFTLMVYEKGPFSGRIYTGGVTSSFTNHFGANGISRFQVLRTGLTPLTVTLQLDLSSLTDQVTGSVSNGGWTAALLGDRNVYSKTNPAPLAGSYSLVVPGSSSPGVPVGDSIGVATVDTLGNVRLTGTLSDGTPLSFGTTISKTGDWPIYVALYSGKGSILSWVSLADSNSIAGDFTWIRPSISASKLYPIGFTNLTITTGGIFGKAAKGIRLLDFTNGVVLLSGGNLPDTLTNSIVLTTNNTFIVSSTNHLTLKLNTLNGLVSGSFLHPKTKLTTPVKGMLIRQQNQGRGFFLGTNESGLFLLQSN